MLPLVEREPLSVLPEFQKQTKCEGEASAGGAPSEAGGAWGAGGTLGAGSLNP